MKVFLVYENSSKFRYCKGISNLVLTLILLIDVHATNENDLIFDYFAYKKVPGVVGFSCNSIKDDYLLAKRFSGNGIFFSIDKCCKESSVKLLTSSNFKRLGVFFDTRCHSINSSISLMLEATNLRIFDDLHHWFVFGNDLSNVMSSVDDSAFGIFTDFIIAVPSDVSNNYKLYDIYNLLGHRKEHMKVTYVGDWSSDTGLSVALTKSKFIMRSNLQRATLKGLFYKCAHKPEGMLLDDYYDTYSSSGEDAQSKYSYHILKHLSDLYNFTLDAKETSTWQPSDTLGPITRSLIDNSADMTGTPISINPTRIKLLRFVHHGWPFSTCFFFRTPQPTNIKIKEIFRPLGKQVWYLMFILLAGSTWLFYWLLRFEWIDSSKNRLSNSILVTMGTMCQQSTDLKINRVSTRILFLSLMIFSVLIYNYYSASIVSVRLNEPIFKINNSLNEFAKLNLKMASEYMIYLEFFLKFPEWETQLFYKNYWLKKPKSEWYMIPETGMELVHQGGFAYHTHLEVAYPIIAKLFDNRELCELTQVNLARPICTAFAFTRNSTILEIGRVGLQKISEFGLRHRELNRWYHRKPHCRKDILTASSINMSEFAPHLMFLIAGAIAAFFILAIEVFTKHYDVEKFKNKFKS